MYLLLGLKSTRRLFLGATIMHVMFSWVDFGFLFPEECHSRGAVKYCGSCGGIEAAVVLVKISVTFPSALGLCNMH